MRVNDLKPGDEVPNPEAPTPTGPDAELFAAYQSLLDREAEFCATPERGPRCDRKSKRAWQKVDDACEKFLDTPARTIEGVILKLEYSFVGELVPPGPDLEWRSKLAALDDLKALAQRANPVRRAA